MIKRIKNIGIIIISIVISIICAINLSEVVFVLTYKKWMSYILIICFLILSVLGVIQVVLNKIKYKYLKGRILGIIFLLGAAGLSLVLISNYFNKIITIANDYDNILVKDVKERFLQIDYGLEEFMIDFELCKIKEYYKDFSSYKKEQIGSINYYYKNDNSKESIDLINDLLNEEGIKYYQYYNLNNVDNIDIMLVDDLVFGESLGSYFNYAKKLIITDKNNFEEIKNGYMDKDIEISNTFEGNIIHEYNHLLFNEALILNKIEFEEVPIWFYEGVATYMTSKYTGVEIDNSTKYTMDITDNKKFRNRDVAEKYDKSSVIVKYMFENKGDNIVIEILEQMTNSNDFYKSLELVINENFKEIESKVVIE